MRRRSKFPPVLIVVVFILMMIVPSPVRAVSLIYNPDADAALRRNKELNEYMNGSPSPAQLKSPAKAFLFSAIVPGTGELYSEARRGLLFMAAEAAFWTAYIVVHGGAKELEDDYVNFVDDHILFEEDSPANSTAKWTMEDYEHATQSDNWHYVYTDNNGKPIERVGKFYWDDLPPGMINEQGGVSISESQSPSRVEAFAKRGSSNDKFEQAKKFLGLIVFNHIVSAVDGKIAATVYNSKAHKISAEVSFHPTVSPSGRPGAYLALRGHF